MKVRSATESPAQPPLLAATLEGAHQVRGVLRLAAIRAANHWLLRLMSYVIDATLLIAAILLTLILHQYPFTDAWLTTKLLLLVLYIVLGTYALKRARTSSGRTAALLGALLTFDDATQPRTVSRPVLSAGQAAKVKWAVLIEDLMRGMLVASLGPSLRGLYVHVSLTYAGIIQLSPTCGRAGCIRPGASRMRHRLHVGSSR